MEERMKRHAALCMLIKLVDENSGCINVGTGKVRRVFNDSSDVVRVEYVTGEIALLADADYQTMNDAVLKWKSENPKEFARILEGMK